MSKIDVTKPVTGINNEILQLSGFDQLKPKNSLWTDDQWQAVVLKGSNILVSAGAGSGKTAVLTERIITHIKNGINVNNLVVLTFTNSAAREMRERVQKEIKKALDAAIEASDSALQIQMQEQLELIDSAQITTFDAYSQYILKKYHYKLNIDKNIKIKDDIILENEINQLLDQLFENKYQKKDPYFLKLIDTYCIMDDKKIRDEVKSAMYTLVNQITPYQVDAYLNEQKYQEYTSEYYQLILTKLSELTTLIKELEQIAVDEKSQEHVAKVKIYFSDLFNHEKYEIFKLNQVRLKRTPTVPRKFAEAEAYKEKYDAVKKKYNEIKELATYETSEAMMQDLIAIKDNVATIMQLGHELLNLLDSYKRETNTYDFIDISRLAIKILQENNELRNELKNDIFEIMIDEYQDTNDIQEYFIDQLANNNVYMVGDIKQSIYGFRNANPENFRAKYLNYQNRSGGIVIDLNKNFRSREEVLENINSIFEPLMDLEIGGIDYVGKQRLIYGNKMYETKNESQNQDVDIISYDPSQTMPRPEQEARIIASDIVEKINSNYQVLDSGELRNIEFKDFAILTSKKKEFELYKKIFEEYKIPLLLEIKSNNETTHEVYVITAVLEIIYCLENEEYYKANFKYALMKLLRSIACNLDDQLINDVMLSSKNITDLLKFENPELNKIEKILSQIKIALTKKSLVEIVIQIVKEFDLIVAISQLEDVHMAEQRILTLIDLFKSFDEKNYNLVDAVNYFEKSERNEKPIEYGNVNIDSENVVNMMSIHKSKGLEFNVVYFPDLVNKFNLTDASSKFKYNNKYGKIIPNYTTEIKINILHELSKNQEIKDNVSEQIRLFYVALTRAKDKMVMLSDQEFSNVNPINKLSNLQKEKYRNFADFLINQQGNLYHYTTRQTTDPILTEIKNLKTENKPEIDLEFDYNTIKMQSQEIMQTRASSSKVSILDNKTKQTMDYGTKIHNILETIDFQGEVELQFHDYTPKEQRIIKNVSELEIIKKAINLYTEYQFTYQVNDQKITGIIDMLIETETEFIILDYKLENIDKPEYVDQINAYVNFIKTKTPKTVSGYLYSLLNDSLKEIK